jgi:multidrug efflux system membrane fusion protein
MEKAMTGFKAGWRGLAAGLIVAGWSAPFLAQQAGAQQAGAQQAGAQQAGAQQAGAQQAGGQPANAPVPVTVGQAERRDVPVFARGIGTVQALNSVLIRARVDGTLDKIAFREGQLVHPGDPIATIDPRPYAAALDQAKARRAADVAQLHNAGLDLARYAALARTNFASRQQLDTQQATVEQDQANIQADDAAIATAALNLSFCDIRSPIDGVVGLRQIDAGNLIHATDATGIVTITQVQPISLVFTLPQSTLPQVQDAMQHGRPPVIAYTSDDGKKLAQGVLVTPNNTIDASTGTISLKAQFANEDRRLWPGEFVDAHIQLGVEKNAVTIPPAAIQHGPDDLYVYVVKPDHTVARQTVTLGYEDEGVAVVTDGLSGGEQVVTNGQVRLQPGSRVAVDAKS